MKVPAAMAIKTVSTIILVSAKMRPKIPPIGVKIAKRKIRAATLHSEKPDLASAPPSESASAPLWITTPKAS